MKKTGLFLFLMILSGFISAQIPSEDPTGKSKFFIRSRSDSAGLVAAYFNNKTLSGTPVGSKIEPAVLHKWNKAPDVPGLNKENFSVRWTGVIRCDSTGDYIFAVAGDDGYRLFIDNHLLIDGWKDQGLTEIKQTLALQKGKEYPVKLEYYQAGGGAVLYFAWYSSAFSNFTFVPKAGWANTEYYQRDNQMTKSPLPGEHRVVFMGDSITEGWEYQRSDFFSQNAYVNRGISGQTTPQMLVRFRADVINLKPEVVVILAGTNDIAGNTGPVTLEQIMDNLKSMCELAKANEIKVVLCSVLPVFDFPWNPGLQPAEKIVSLNAMIKKYADKNGILYVDYFSKMVDGKNGLKKDLGDDGVHPNGAGYSIMEPLVKDAIETTLTGK